MSNIEVILKHFFRLSTMAKKEQPATPPEQLPDKIPPQALEMEQETKKVGKNKRVKIRQSIVTKALKRMRNY